MICVKAYHHFFVERGLKVVNRLTLTLEQPEYAGLLKIAIRELRNPSDQLRHILRQELKQQNLLPIELNTAENKSETAEKGGSDAGNNGN